MTNINHLHSRLGELSPTAALFISKTDEQVLGKGKVMKMNQVRAITECSRFIKACVAGLALTLAFATGGSHLQAQTVYSWTNTAATSFFNDPGVWSPVGVPSTSLDSFTIAKSGTFTISVTNGANPLSNIGSFQIGAAAAGQVLNLTMDFGTNNFLGLSGNASAASAFVFGQTGTSIVYVTCGTMYCTNSSAGARATFGRNNGAPVQFNFTNGTFVGQSTVLANNAGATPSKVVISGPNTSWTNSNTFSIGNAASASFNSVVVSNSASLTAMNNLQAGFSATSHSNSIVVDSGGKIFARGANQTLGAGGTSIGNVGTVQGGGLWEAGGQNITLGAGGGTGNGLFIGNNGVISNASFVFVSAGNFVMLSNGLLNVSKAVTNTSGTVGGFGVIAGDVAFAGTGTLSPSVGNQVGALTFSNNLTLVSGSTTIIRLDSSQTPSNSSVNVAGTATIAGTLSVVTNGIAPLQAGDIYNIGITGGFTTTNLPPLDPTYRWNNVTPGILAIVPQEVVPGCISPCITNFVATIGDTVNISVTVTGVPTPGVYWQINGVTLTDGIQGDGSTNSGAATTSLTIQNIQTGENGTLCLIATNIVGASTNCAALTVSGGCDVPPSISGVSDQTVCQGNNATFSAAVAGCPSPSIQWFENGSTITDATGSPLVLTNVQFSQDGFVYSITASNDFGVASTNMTLHVNVGSTITSHPVSLVVTDTQGASFSVMASGVPAPTYQWYFNNNAILNETNSTYTIASASISNAGTYRVQVSNPCASLSSSNATLTVNSTMAATLSPTNSQATVCYDTPLFMAFDRPPVRSGTGTIKIYNVTNGVIPVETIDTSAGNLQVRTIGTESFLVFPVIITGNRAALYPHNGILSSNQTYFVTVDPGTFTDTNGALYAGISDTNAWRFTTKPNGPADPNNIIVSADNSADFATVQGAVDFVPNANGIHRLVKVQDGDYNELVDTRGKSNITFRGQSIAGTIVGYRNNDSQNSGTHNRMAFKVFADDIAIENMTITNRTPKGGTQAEAIMIESNIKRFIFNHAKVASYQDTILGNTGGTQAYFKDSLIVGDTDFIWGSMNAYFTNCELQCQSVQSHVTQARTDDNPSTSNGMAFVYCTITRPSVLVTNCDLGRTLGFPYGEVIFKHCRIDDHITGWSDPSLRDYEFDNSNLTATAAVTYNGIQLTNGDPVVTCADDPNCWLYGWNAQLAPNVLSGPTNLTVTPGQSASFTVSATGLPDPTYQWQKAGTNLVGQTSATLTIASADSGDADTYSVIVANVAGSVTNSATLTVVLNAFQTWQAQHFGCTLCPQAAPNADPDGDGLSNQDEYLAGSDPTDSGSALRITSAQTQGSDVVVTWLTFGGHTNVLQVTPGELDGSYSTNGFVDIPASQAVIPGSGSVTTSYTDVGAATNAPARYYRIRLVP